MSQNPDQWSFRLITVVLSAGMLGTLATVCYLAATSRPVDSLLAGLVGTLIGNLTPSILSKGKTTSDAPLVLAPAGTVEQVKTAPPLEPAEVPDAADHI